MPEPVARVKSMFSSSKALLLLVAVYVAVNARWIWLYRQNNLLDIDEAGYLGMAFSYYRSLSGSGLGDWFKSVLSPGIQAPITPALASLLFWISTPSILTGFAVPLLAGVICVLSTYWLARCLMSAPAALWAAALVASCPLLTIFARSFHFSIPATALFTLSLVCMLRSRNFASLLWASLFGICVGLLPLTRTMTIAFLPGLFVGAAVHTVAQLRALSQRLGVLLWSTFLAIIVSGSWLVGSSSLVFGYLFNFGYGKQASEYGVKYSLLELSAWRHMVVMNLDYLSLPHALVLLAGILASLLLALRTVKRHGASDALNQWTHSPVFPLAMVLLCCVAALSSSQNSGSAFVAPVIPLSIVLSVWAINSCLFSGFSRTIAASLGGLICLTASIPLADASWSMSRPWRVKIPILESEVNITDGRGTAFVGLGDGRGQEYPVGGSFNGANTSSSNSLSPKKRQAWIALADAASHAVKAESAASKGGVAFGFRHFLLNPNTVRLSSLIQGGDLPPLYMVAPVQIGDSVSAYQIWLTKGDASAASLLFTLSGEQGEYMPKVSKELFVQAAQIAGFEPTQSWLAPTGQQLQLWKRELPGNAGK